MSSDVDYLAKYLTDKLYIHPATGGCYATMVAENETLIGEVEVTSRTRVAISAFYVKNRGDFNSFKITRLIHDKRFGWQEDGCIKVNAFEIGKIRTFTNVISMLDLSDAQKVRLSLDQVTINGLEQLIGSSEGEELLAKLSNSPELRHDIIALQAKREALQKFEQLLREDPAEAEWQAFFEENTWIFGYGLNYIPLSKVAEKLEQVTTGAAVNQNGKRVDALLRTKAEVSQTVLVEIKKNNTKLLAEDTYRSGCWAVSREVSGAVAQAQKTAFEFSKAHFRMRLKDSDGNDTTEEVFIVEPETYLIAGNLKQIAGNDDKIACFELFRKSLKSPHIMTFDELYFRANFIVETLKKQ